MPAQRRTDLQVLARIVKEDLLSFPAFARSQIRPRAPDASQPDQAELFALKSPALTEPSGQPVDHALRKDWTTEFQFHCCPGPRDHCKGRWLFFKQKHAERRLLDTAN